MNNFKMVFLFAVGICDTNRMMSMLKEVSVVENRQWPAVKHNLLIVLHALANESLCLNALGHIQYPQKLPPDIWLARHNWRKLKTNDINRHQVFGFFSFGFFFLKRQYCCLRIVDLYVYVPDQYPIGYFAIPNVIH